MTIQYQGVWSLQSAAQLQSTQRWVTDPLYKNTTLLLQADDAANGAQNNTFLDSSSNAFAITRNGNTTQGSFTPFSSQSGAWSNYFDGSGDRLVLATNTALDLTDDFTIECWIYPTAISTFNIIFDTALNGTAGANMTELFLSSPNTLSYYARGSTLLSGTGITLNSWQHVALTKSGTTQRLFLNGVVIASTTSSTQPNTGYSWYIGDRIAGAPSSQYPFSGNISNFRVVKGVAVYTGNFTPPPLPLTTTQSAGVNIAAVTGTQTSLLTCQGNRFIDISSNTLPIIREGDTAAQPFSPFAPQYQWTPSVIGGSGYFDGTGDSLTMASSSAFAVGTVFTMECWIYPLTSGTSAGQPLFVNGSTGEIQFGYQGATSWAIAANNVVWRLTSSTMPFVNAWNHVVVVRSGLGTNQTSLFLNGTRVANGTVADTFTSAGTGNIGLYGSGTYTGYISSLRIVKGTAVYDPSLTTCTVPTAPLTAITNTQLLTNFTNAGIYDGTMKNNLETVGNASVSTAVVKYGSGSLYFDGTGDAVAAYSPTPVISTLGDFTAEAWVYVTSASDNTVFYLNGNATSYAGCRCGVNGNQIYLLVSTNGSSWAINSGNISSVPSNTWHHIAVVRLAGTFYLFLNGTSIFTSTAVSAATALMSGSINLIGAINSSGISSSLNGYIDDARVTRLARYTQNFIPPSVALPRQ